MWILELRIERRVIMEQRVTDAEVKTIAYCGCRPTRVTGDAVKQATVRWSSLVGGVGYAGTSVVSVTQRCRGAQCAQAEQAEQAEELRHGLFLVDGARGSGDGQRGDAVLSTGEGYGECNGECCKRGEEVASELQGLVGPACARSVGGGGSL
jgi:hypothetical protein